MQACTPHTVTGFSRPVDNLCKERGVAKRRLAAAESRSFGTALNAVGIACILRPSSTARRSVAAASGANARDQGRRLVPKLPNYLVRILAGIALGEIMGLPTFAGGRPFLVAYVFVVYLISIECTGFVVRAQRWALFLVSASILVAAHCKVLTGIFECAAVTLLGLMLVLQGNTKSPDGSSPISFSHIASQVFGVFYVGYLPSFWVRLRAMGPLLPAGAPSGFLTGLLRLIHWPLDRSVGCCVTVSCVLCIIAADSFAYFGGKTWGKTPLIMISPKKTQEGALCGLLGSVLMALLCDQAWGFPSDPLVSASVGALVFYASLLGDLVVSAMKRDAKVKDAGSLIPGHGGILDRFDSYFFAPAVAYFCWPVAMDASQWLAELPSNPEAYAWWPIILYMFYLMSVVCDDYLLPAVDAISARFHIPDDVAGATLVAFACNGPELLTNSCSIYLNDSSVGMGTIVGSAIFNVLVITGCCPLVAPKRALKINPAFFLRDAGFSAVSIWLLWWALPVVDLLRASTLLAFSVLYAVVVAKSEQWFGGHHYDGTESLASGLITSPSKIARQVSELSMDDLQMPLVTSRRTLVDVLLSPGGVLLWLTIPNVKLQPSRYFGSFFVSMAWLSITAYVVCLGSDRINLFWGIPRSFLGLTLVAVGTSWPNLLASVATARQGRGEMAVSNALGSNVQNVFFVLALPIFVSVLVRGDYTSDSAEILSSVLWMGATLAVVGLLISFSGFVLRAWAGAIFVGVYFLYLIQASRELLA
ncbi:unnamed protein product [Effrenium voratum]|uniref:Phosphatidate cytidylyltransferase n=1 Tax=Effrenium voratum TaxID=2562239 RepID=A0AA36N3T2_9DINO|nr:unnamed protein product [Effrenium voratum]